MAKSNRPGKYNADDEELSKMEEPIAEYTPAKRLPQVAEFPHKKFEKIAALVPFTLKEWAAILHLSERTLQRYAKYNTSFEGLYVDRILQIERMVQLGLETFVSGEALYRWLHREKKVLGQLLNFDSLSTTQGIQDITDQIGRIQYGVYT